MHRTRRPNVINTYNPTVQAKNILFGLALGLPLLGAFMVAMVNLH